MEYKDDDLTSNKYQQAQAEMLDLLSWTNFFIKYSSIPIFAAMY